MNVEAVDLAAGGEAATTLLAMLDTATPRLHVIAATPTRLVSALATYQGDDFVMARGAVGGDAVACLVGPAAALPSEIGRLLTALSEAASVPLKPQFADIPVPVPDALVLAEDIRVGAFDDLSTALRVAHLNNVPCWLNDLAHGVSATFLVLVSGPQGTGVGTHLIGLPSGWGHLVDLDGELAMRPKDADQLLAELDEVALFAASLVGDF